MFTDAPSRVRLKKPCESQAEDVCVDAVVRFTNAAIGNMPVVVFEGDRVPLRKQIARPEANLFIKLEFPARIRRLDVRQTEPNAAIHEWGERRARREVVAKARVQADEIGAVRVMLGPRKELPDRFDISAEPIIGLHHIGKNQTTLDLSEPKVVRKVRA